MRRRPWRDIALVALAFALCPLVAALAPTDPAVPLRRAQDLVDFERGLHLFFEADAHRWLTRHPGLAAGADFIYLWVHFPATVGALVWAWLERPRVFALARDSFLATQAVVVCGYLVVPTAPLRMLLGDTATGGLAQIVQSPYAAMPSGHVAFSLVVAAIVTTQARALRFVAPLYPLLVTTVVVFTANHVWLDAVAGVVAAVTGLALAVIGRTLRATFANRIRLEPRTEDHVGPDSPSPPRRAGAASRA